VRAVLVKRYGELNRYFWMALGIIGVVSTVVWTQFPRTADAFDNIPLMQSSFGKGLGLALFLL
jgi:hypothetical protein